eukprot:COSAG06_NODE_1341_length_9798_cov_3.432931_9_plen_362_part_00
MDPPPPPLILVATDAVRAENLACSGPGPRKHTESMPRFRTSAHEESQLLDMVQQYWDPSAGRPSWKAIGLLLGCTADTASHRWKDKSTKFLTPKAKAAAEAAGKAAAKQRVEERHEIVLRERSAGATWDEAAVEAPNLNGDGGRGTGAALQKYWARSPLVTDEVNAAVEAARAAAKKKAEKKVAEKKVEGKKKKKAEKKAEGNEQRTLRNLCAQALAKFGPYLNTLAPSGADRRLLVVAHDAEGWRELKAFGDRCYEGSALYVEVCKAYDAPTHVAAAPASPVPPPSSARDQCAGVRSAARSAVVGRSAKAAVTMWRKGADPAGAHRQWTSPSGSSVGERVELPRVRGLGADALRHLRRRS